MVILDISFLNCVEFVTEKPFWFCRGARTLPARNCRTNTASILDRARLPQHKNISTEERKALRNLKKDPTRIVTKADKGNSLVVMDRSDYESKMTNLLQDKTTYTVVRKAPFRKVERELNAMLLDLKNQEKTP